VLTLFSVRAYHEQLVDVKSRLSMMSKRLQTTETEHEMTRKELGELQDKYQDRVREKQKLEELYNTMKRKYDQSCRESLQTQRISLPAEDRMNNSSGFSGKDGSSSVVSVRSDYQSFTKNNPSKKTSERHGKCYSQIEIDYINTSNRISKFFERYSFN
jgi:chromosome segregation ATPase